jgi:LCP family protein required for cell wall assembly
MLHRSKYASRRRLALRVAIAVITVGVLGVGAGGWLYVRSLTDAVGRTDAFGADPEASRPAKVADDALNYLILGADTADDDDSGGAARADTIILVHLPSDRRSAQFISIPRDTWVPIPPAQDGAGGGTTAKINAAYAWGGVALMVQTVEAFTGIRIDHAAVIDFDGFARIIDALGGIDITVDTAFVSASPPYRPFAAGHQHMDGTVALDYARQRKPFADGDFARMRHQREIISAVFQRAAGLNVLTSPTTLDNVIRSTASAVTIDDTMSILDVVGFMRDLKQADLAMLTSPSSGTGMVGDQSVVFADSTEAGALFDAVRTDAMSTWLAQHAD